MSAVYRTSSTSSNGFAALEENAFLIRPQKFSRVLERAFSTVAVSSPGRTTSSDAAITGSRTFSRGGFCRDSESLSDSRAVICSDGFNILFFLSAFKINGVKIARIIKATQNTRI